MSERNKFEDWLEYNEDIRLNCPNCSDVWYGEDCPTYCTTCGCTSGQGNISLRTFVEEMKIRVCF